MRTRTMLLPAVALTAALTTAFRRRRTALVDVPSDLRHPMLYLPLDVTSKVLPLMRAVRPRPTGLVDGVDARRLTIPGPEGADEIPVWVYRPAASNGRTGALVWMHGGGYVVGSPEVQHHVCSRLSAELGIVVVSVDYRLAPEHPFPAPLEDCYAALRWVHTHSDELDVDPARVAVGGESAGGGLAACLAQLAVDRGEHPVAFQLLIYPMLDDRTVLREDHRGTGRFIWSPRSNRFGWTAYLGRTPHGDAAPPYAAAARREDLTGLPPAWIGVGDLDLFHAEDHDYARRLSAAGVPCELHVAPGMYHGADAFVPDARASTAFRGAMTAALSTALTTDQQG